jgi:hypothetical protein
MIIYPLDNAVAAVESVRDALGPEVLTRLMYAQTSDATFRSCDYHFEDNPRALALAQQATPLMEKAGYLTAADLADAANIFFLSDHPFNPNELVFTVVLHGLGGTQVESPRGTVSAVFNRQSGKVISLGHGNLYANCSAKKDCRPSK